MHTSASSVLLCRLLDSDWMMGWSGLISRERRPRMYSAERLSDSICMPGMTEQSSAYRYDCMSCRFSKHSLS